MQRVNPSIASPLFLATGLAWAINRRTDAQGQVSHKNAPCKIRKVARYSDRAAPITCDPRGVYFQNPALEKDVLTIATNGYGGYVAKPAACEFKNCHLDQDWIKINASRAGR